MTNTIISKEFTVGGRIIVEDTFHDIAIWRDRETGYYYGQKICNDNDKRMEHLNEN